MSMFCYQCQETINGTGCTVGGACGKKANVANMQDLLIFVLKGISIYGVKAREVGVELEEVNAFLLTSLFMTITNANFDEARIIESVQQGLALRAKLKAEFIKAGGDVSGITQDAANWSGFTVADFEAKNTSIGVLATENEDVRSLRELIIYGLKGLAAYTEHALNLGFTNPELNAFVQKALAATTDDSLTADELVALVLETGENGVTAMALLDEANTTKYGNPEITAVNIGVSDKPAILISGHDLRDMEDLLIQTDGTGVDVYTHSEMLPANYYPEFKKYSHFIGNYGNAWWKQKEEFTSFNGPILFTTNCSIWLSWINAYSRQKRGNS